MTLREYLSHHRITYRAFGQKLGRDGAEVWRWAHGHRTPSLEMALRIQEETGRAVSVDALVTTREAV